MARTPSNMLPLGTKAPSFKLLNTINNNLVEIADLQVNKGLLVMFICNHCPFVKHIENEISKIGEFCRENDVSVVAISSNDIENYPEDSPEKMSAFASSNGFNFPYLYDETQEVAKSYDAACTPDFYLFNGDLELVYRGQLDDSRPGNDIPVTGSDLRRAISSLVNDLPIFEDQQPSLGCNIKWKS